MIQHQLQLSTEPILIRTERIPPYLAELSRSGPEQDMPRLQEAWARYRKCRDRNAVYDFLDAVFRVCTRWQLNRTAKAGDTSQPVRCTDPVAGIMRSASGGQLDRRTAAKWSRAVRFALASKTTSEPLETFVLRNGGINSCALARRKTMGRRPKREQNYRTSRER